MLKQFLNNKREILSGALAGGIFLFPLPYAILGAIVCAILWRLEGQIGGGWRWLGVPITISAWYILTFSNPIYLLLMAGAAPLTLGYGVPDATDKGSLLGRFFVQFTKGVQPLTDILVRGAYALLFSIALFAIVFANAFYWVLFGVLFTACYILVNILPIK